MLKGVQLEHKDMVLVGFEEGFDDMDLLLTPTEAQMKEVVQNQIDMRTGHRIKFLEEWVKAKAAM